MNLDYLFDDIFLYCLSPYLNFYGLYNLSLVSKKLNEKCKNIKFKWKDVYDYVTETVKSNLYNKKFILSNCVFMKTKYNKFCYYNYDKQLEDGIYFCSKHMPYNETNPLSLNILTYNIYVFIFILNNIHKTYLLYKYSHFIIDDIHDYIFLNNGEKIIKIF